MAIPKEVWLLLYQDPRSLSDKQVNLLLRYKETITNHLDMIYNFLFSGLETKAFRRKKQAELEAMSTEELRNLLQLHLDEAGGSAIDSLDEEKQREWGIEEELLFSVLRRRNESLVRV